MKKKSKHSAATIAETAPPRRPPTIAAASTGSTSTSAALVGNTPTAEDDEHARDRERPRTAGEPAERPELTRIARVRRVPRSRACPYKTPWRRSGHKNVGSRRGPCRVLPGPLRTECRGGPAIDRVLAPRPGRRGRRRADDQSRPAPVALARDPDPPRSRTACSGGRSPPSSSSTSASGKPTALAVFASDNLSSSAYATEEILRVLIPAVGVAAFAMVVPITIALLVVLAFLILSYLQTIKAYPTRRRRVHRHARQLRAAARAGRRRRARSPTTSSPSRCRSRPAPPRSARRSPALAPYVAADLDRLRRAHRVRQPARRARVGPALRGPDLLLHRSTWCVLLGVGLWKLADGHARRSSDSTSPGMVARRAASATGSSWARRSTSCCTRSRRAAPRSPVSRRSPTACPRSESRRGRTPASRS